MEQFKRTLSNAQLLLADAMDMMDMDSKQWSKLDEVQRMIEEVERSVNRQVTC